MGCGQSSRVKAMKDGRDSVDTNETLPVTAPRRTVQQPDRNGVQVVDELDDVLIDNAERLVVVRIVKQSEGEILNTDSFFESLAKIHRGSKFVYLCADDDDEDEGDESPAVVVFSDGEQMEEILESEYQRDHGTLKWVLSKLDKTMKSRDSKQQRLADLGGTSSMGRRGSLPLAQGRSVLSCDFTLSEEGSKAVEPLALTLVLSKASPRPPPKPVPVVRQPMKLAKLKSPAPMSLTSSKKSKFMTNTNYDVGKVEMPSTFMTQSCNGRIEQRSFLDQLMDESGDGGLVGAGQVPSLSLAGAGSPKAQRLGIGSRAFNVRESGVPAN